MSFQWPLFLLAALLAPLLVAAVLLWERRPAPYPVAFTNLEVLASVVEKRSWRRYVPLGLLVLALLLAATALGRPHANLSVPEENATVVLVVDVSLSMRADDIEPTRLDASTAAMRTFLDRLPDQFKVGLVSFSSEAEVLVEPTRDRDRLREAVTYLYPASGTAIGDGLQEGVQLVRRSLAEEGVEVEEGETFPGAIILLSDGDQNAGSLRPGQAAQNARTRQIVVHTIALGTADGTLTEGFGENTEAQPVPSDPETMRQIARITGGHTFTAEGATTLADIYRSLGSSIGRRTEPREITSWFAAATALLLVGALGAARVGEGRLP